MGKQALFSAYRRTRGFFDRIGSLVVAFNEEEMKELGGFIQKRAKQPSRRLGTSRWR